VSPEVSVSAGAWDCHDDGVGTLPPDLTGYQEQPCGQLWRVWGCTRRAGHTGRHAAGTGREIVAVWPGGGDRR
jgi:hypothetical protein